MILRQIHLINKIFQNKSETVTGKHWTEYIQSMGVNRIRFFSLFHNAHFWRESPNTRASLILNLSPITEKFNSVKYSIVNYQRRVHSFYYHYLRFLLLICCTLVRLNFGGNFTRAT